MTRSLYINKQTVTSFLSFWGIPLVITLLYIFLAAEPELRLAVPLLAGVTSIQVILLATALFLGERSIVRWPPWFILVFAALFRLLFLFQAPQLSDDIYRYLWDGLQSLAGNNPYTLQPDIAPAFNDAMMLLRGKINNSDLVTIYPPASQIFFTAGAFLSKGPFGTKVLMALIDIVTCFLMFRILSALEIKAYRAILYAWHPLPIIEIASSGHVDGIGFLFLFLAVLFLFRQPGSKKNNERKHKISSISFIPCVLGGFLFSLSIMIKYFTLVYLPGLMLPGRLRNKAVFLTAFITGILFLSFPLMPDFKNSFLTLNTYLYNWEFAGFAFRFLRKIITDWEMPRKILLITFITVTAALYARLFYFALSSDKPSDKALLLSRFLNTCYLISFVFLLLTPTLHPWYALSLICFLPFSAGPAGLVLSWSVFLGYRVLIPYTIMGVWEENTTTAFMIWAAPVITFAAAYLGNRLKRLPPAVKHIDDGQGEGFSG